MTKIIYIIGAVFLLGGCGSSKSTTGHSSTTVKRTRPSTTSDKKFIDGISFSPGDEGPSNPKHPNTGWFGAPDEARNTNLYGNIENSTELHFKYAILLDQPVEYLTNLSLLKYIEDWYGTRYRYGGNTKQGVDCSGFTCNLSNSVFGKTLPRTARQQYDAAQKIPVQYLQEGDLVFFNTRGGISHVGIYLANNKFVHASTSSGVIISDLNEEYYRKRFVGAGRL